MAKTVLKFSATWCGPCKAYAPIFSKVREELQDSIEFQEIDIDQDPERLTTKYGVTAVPTTIVLEKGKDLRDVKGALSEDQLKQFILK